MTVAERVSNFLAGRYYEERTKNHDDLCVAIEPYLAHRSPRGLLLLGPPGVGKTYFCKCVVGGLRTLTISGLVKQLAEETTADRDIEMFGDMAIDDLGTEQPLFGRDYAPMLIDLRWRAFEYGHSTFFTTNLNRKELLERYDGRVISRILGMCDIFEMKGIDQRLCRVPEVGKHG